MRSCDPSGQGSNPTAVLFFSDVFMTVRNLKYDFRPKLTILNTFNSFLIRLKVCPEKIVTGVDWSL